MLDLNGAIGGDGCFPETLSNLTQFQVVPKEGTNAWLMVPDLDSNYFVCPGTGSIPGSISNVEEWSDYIYIGNSKNTIPDVPVLISPPENHNGKYGYIVVPGQATMRLPSSEVRAVIKEPWILATNETPDNIENVKRDIIVNVPRRLRAYYTNVNNWMRPKNTINP